MHRPLTVPNAVDIVRAEVRVRALVVDDSKITRRLLAQLLEEQGFAEVLTAADGLEALGLVERSRPFDLVLTDWRMPRLDGLAFLERARQDERGRDVPFIVISSVSDDDAVATLFAAGARHFIRKPFEPASVRRVIAEVTRVEQLRRSPPAALTGTLASASVVELVQFLSLTGRSGALSIDDDGRIDVEGGRVIAARAGGARGEAAFHELALRAAGTFRFEPDARAAARDIDRPTPTLLFEALRRHDERARALAEAS